MVELIAQNLAPIMFASLVIFLLLGYPAAFSLAANGLVFFIIGVELAPHSGGQIHLFWNLLGALPDRFYGVMSNETLLAIPFFTFMGLILERSGMAEDLLDTVGQLFGSIKGGLAYAVVLVGAVLAATTGVVAASVISMGLISLPIMLRYGYDRRLATGVIAASGTLSQIIPPSLVLIVLADQLGRSVGDMYAGAIIPSVVLTALYLGYVVLATNLSPTAAPALPPEARPLGAGGKSFWIVLLFVAGGGYGLSVFLGPSLGENATIWAFAIVVGAAYAIALIDKAMKGNLLSPMTQQVVIVLIPPLALIFLVLGTIFLGIATPTEGGAMGAAGALVLALAKRRLTMPLLSQALASTTRLAAFVMFILLGARVFSLTFYGVNGHLWVEHLLTSVPGGQIGFLIVVNLIVFFLAFFLDFFELAFIIVPLLAPVAEKLGIDLIWFGVLLGINMQTSFMHPPFGFALFYLRSVAARVPYIDKITGLKMEPITTAQIYWGAVPFVIIQVIMVVITISFPIMVTHYKQNVPVQSKDMKIVIPTFDSSGGAPNFSTPAVPNFGGGGQDSGGGNGGTSTPATPGGFTVPAPPKF